MVGQTYRQTDRQTSNQMTSFAPQRFFCFCTRGHAPPLLPPVRASRLSSKQMNTLLMVLPYLAPPPFFTFQMYSVLFYDPESQQYTTKIRMKGLSKQTAKRCLSMDDYKMCLLNGTCRAYETPQLRHNKHEIYLQMLTKSCMSPWNSKRYQINMIQSCMFYHPDIPGYETKKLEGRSGESDTEKSTVTIHLEDFLY